jgi:hypothetical protein
VIGCYTEHRPTQLATIGQRSAYFQGSFNKLPCRGWLQLNLAMGFTSQVLKLAYTATPCMFQHEGCSCVYMCMPCMLQHSSFARTLTVLTDPASTPADTQKATLCAVHITKATNHCCCLGVQVAANTICLYSLSTSRHTSCLVWMPVKDRSGA